METTDTCYGCGFDGECNCHAGYWSDRRRDAAARAAVGRRDRVRELAAHHRHMDNWSWTQCDACYRAEQRLQRALRIARTVPELPRVECRRRSITLHRAGHDAVRATWDGVWKTPAGWALTSGHAVDLLETT